MKPLSLLLLLASGTCLLNASAQVPLLFNYQGRLVDGTNLVNGPVSLNLSLYDHPTAGVRLYKEVDSVMVVDGLYATTIGDNGIVDDLRTALVQPEVYLQVNVGPTVLAPRERLTTVVYAFLAGGVTNQAITTDMLASGAVEPQHLSGATDNLYVHKWGDTMTGLLSLSLDGLEVANNQLVLANSNVGIGTGIPDEKLHVENSASAGGAFLKMEASHATNWGETGLRFKTPQNTWHFRMDDDSNNNLPEGAIALRSQTPGHELMTWTTNRSVGIGTTQPSAELDVVGDLEVSGAYRGNIGPNNGAPFPRSAYNSGWVAISTGQVVTLTHNVGGDADDYVVDMQFRNDVGGVLAPGRHVIGHGGTGEFLIGAAGGYGAYYSSLTSTSIKVVRRTEDTVVREIRIRIWVEN